LISPSKTSSEKKRVRSCKTTFAVNPPVHFSLLSGVTIGLQGKTRGVASLYYNRFDLLPRGKEEKEGWLTGDQEDEIRGCVVRMEEAMIFGR